jgi:hypothetical protein
MSRIERIYGKQQVAPAAVYKHFALLVVLCLLQKWDAQANGMF